MSKLPHILLVDDDPVALDLTRRYLALRGNGFWRSSDRGATWTKPSTQPRDNYGKLTADPSAGGRVWAYHVSGMDYSSTGGSAWSAVGGFTSATVLGIPRSAADAMADLEGFKYGLEQLLAPDFDLSEIKKAKELAKKFRDNDKKFDMPEAVRNAGPVVTAGATVRYDQASVPGLEHHLLRALVLDDEHAARRGCDVSGRRGG